MSVAVHLHESLRVLNISKMNYSSQGVTSATIHAIARHCTGLRELYMGGYAHAVFDSALQLLAAHCSKLQCLSIEGASQVR